MLRAFVAGGGLVVSQLAHAETRTDAIGVNVPFILGLAASGYVALDEHFGVRVNVARYSKLESLDSDGNHEGYTFDVGAGVMWFPRRMMSGFHVEAGLLYRDDQRSADANQLDYQLYALRGMVGWCWRFDSFFFDTAIGAARGIDGGTWPEHVEKSFEPEMYVRFGLAFDFRS